MKGDIFHETNVTCSLDGVFQDLLFINIFCNDFFMTWNRVSLPATAQMSDDNLRIVSQITFAFLNGFKMNIVETLPCFGWFGYFRHFLYSNTYFCGHQFLKNKIECLLSFLISLKYLLVEQEVEILTP
jgi:hypothetical protein